MGRSFFYEKEVDSTQDSLRKRLQTISTKNGTCLLADNQVNGRGTRQKKWFSLPSPQIYISIYLKLENIQNTPPTLYNLLVAYSAIQAIQSLDNSLSPKIKWPNDLYLLDKKFCGVLSEYFKQGGDQDGLIIGIGINIDAAEKDFPLELRDIATALNCHSMKRIRRFDLITNFLNHLESNLNALVENKLNLQNIFNQHAMWLNKKVTIQDESQTNETIGILKGIDPRGFLLITQDKTLQEELIYTGTLRLSNPTKNDSQNC